MNTIDFIIERKLTRMSSMFHSINSLKKIELLSIEISQATDMSKMFYEYQELEYINFNNLDTSNVKSMEQTFSGCYK